MGQQRFGGRGARSVVALALGLVVGSSALGGAADAVAQAAGGNLAITSVTCTVDAAAGEPVGAAFAVSDPGGAVSAPQTTETCTPEPAAFEIVPFGDAALPPIPVATDEVGVAFLEGTVPATDGVPHVLIELTTGDSTPFAVAVGELTVIDATLYLVDDGAVVERPTGDLAITSLACSAAEAGAAVTVVAPSPGNVAAPPEATDGCAPAAADLAIYPFGDLAADPIAVATDATGLLVLDDQLPITIDAEAHLVVDVASGESAPFGVVADVLTLIDITTDVVAAQTGGTLDLRAYACTEGVGGAGGVDLLAFPAGDPTGSAEVPNASCVPAAFAGSVLPFSDAALAPLAVALDAAGAATFAVPATHSVPHLLTGATSGASVPFAIDPGTATTVVALILVAAAPTEEPPAAVPTETPTDCACETPAAAPVFTATAVPAAAGSGAVAALPNTGAGAARRAGSPPVAALAGLAALALFAAMSTARRRPA